MKIKSVVYRGRNLESLLSDALKVRSGVCAAAPHPAPGAISQPLSASGLGGGLLLQSGAVIDENQSLAQCLAHSQLCRTERTVFCGKGQVRAQGRGWRKEVNTEVPGLEWQPLLVESGARGAAAGPGRSEATGRGTGALRQCLG